MSASVPSSYPLVVSTHPPARLGKPGPLRDPDFMGKALCFRPVRCQSAFPAHWDREPRPAVPREDRATCPPASSHFHGGLSCSGLNPAPEHASAHAGMNEWMKSKESPGDRLPLLTSGARAATIRAGLSPLPPLPWAPWIEAWAASILEPQGKDNGKEARGANSEEGDIGQGGQGAGGLRGQE